MALSMTGTLSPILLHLRWPNLLLIVGCLAIFRFKLRTIFNAHGLELQLGLIEFWILTLALVVLTLGGYWVNDLYDQATDSYNQKKRANGGLTPLLLKRGIIYLTAIGLLLSVYVAWQTHLWPWLILYPVIGGCLWAYARYLKGTPLIGNMVIALLSAGVPLILLVPEGPQLALLPSQGLGRIYLIFFGFALYAFGVSLFREIVKDLEDVVGDRRAGIRTIAVAWGAQTATYLAQVPILLLVLLSAGVGIWGSGPRTSSWLFYVLAVMLLFLSLQLMGARDRRSYTHTSTAAKIVLILGLVFVCIV
jgi:4-hydroxybenzoate polyprenyltransferase